jgi:hypothetical protein
MNHPIDWTALAEQLGVLRNGRDERVGTKDARRALETLIGEPAIRATVDDYIAGVPGSELARSVLWLLRPWPAMAYCYEIWQSARGIEDRRTAVELLRVVADQRALSWVNDFLDDQDQGIQSWGVGVLDQLIWSGLVPPEEAEPPLSKAEAHSNPAVRERAEFIRDYLRARQGQAPYGEPSA